MDDSNTFELKGKVLCFITGASRGFGRALTLAFSRVLDNGSCLAVVARNERLLREVKDSIFLQNPSLKVLVFSEDLTKVSYEKAKELFQKTKNEVTFDKAILVHNVGTLGDVSKTVDKFNNFTLIQQYLDLNLSSVFTLTAAFLQEFQNLVSKNQSTLVVNVTSLAAIEPFPGWAQYCSAKSAREMYFKVLTKEFPSISLLNYSPGPMETDMTTDILQYSLPSIQEWFQNAKAEGKLLTCESSVEKLLHVLKTRKYKSGDRIDYYDVKIDKT